MFSFFLSLFLIIIIDTYTPGAYSVNKPLQAAGILEDNAQKNSRLPSKLRFWVNCSLFGQSFSQGHYPPIYQQARKGFIYFITLRLISTTRFIADK